MHPIDAAKTRSIPTAERADRAVREIIAAREQSIQELASKVFALGTIIKQAHDDLCKAMDRKEPAFVDAARSRLGDAIEDYRC